MTTINPLYPSGLERMPDGLSAPEAAANPLGVDVPQPVERVHEDHLLQADSYDTPADLESLALETQSPEKDPAQDPMQTRLLAEDWPGVVAGSRLLLEGGANAAAPAQRLDYSQLSSLLAPALAALPR
jgi:hypothetical protein